MTISITKKLSGSHISCSISFSCNFIKYVRPLEDKKFTIFDMNPITKSEYPEKLDCEDSDNLVEVHHRFLCVNDLDYTPLFLEGKHSSGVTYKVVISDGPIPGVFDIIKAGTTTTIIKIDQTPPDFDYWKSTGLGLGILTYSYYYQMRNDFSLSCSVVDPDIPQPTVTLNFETLEIPWEPDTTYTIEIDNNFVNHAYGEKYGNPSFVETFTTNPPARVIDFDHTNKKLTIEYIRNIKKVTGTYSLYKSDGTLIENYDHVNSSLNGKFIEFDTYRDLEPLTTYYLLSSTGPCLDKDNIPAEQITDINLVRYITGPGPMVNKLFPGNFVENMPLGNIEETTYNEMHPAGVVKSKITKFILNWDRPIDRFFGIGGTTSIFLYGKPTGSIESPSLIEEWDFHWYEAPGQNEYSYDFNTTQIVLDMVPGLLREDYDYSFLIIPEIARDDDYFYNPELSGGVLDFTTDSEYFPGLKSDLLSISNVTANNVRPRTFHMEYYSTASTIINSMRVRLGNSYMNSTASISATPRYLARITGASNKNYIANYDNYIFTSVVFKDHDVGANYTVTFSSPNGKFGTTSGSVVEYTLTGTLSQINSDIKSVAFWPTKNYASSTNYTISLYRDGELMQSQNYLLTYTSTYTGQTYLFTSSSSWTPKSADIEYGAIMDCTLVGGGGAGAAAVNLDGDPSGTGGGGAGQYIYSANRTIENKTYAVEVGQGGPQWNELGSNPKNIRLHTPDNLISLNAISNWTEFLELYRAPSGSQSSFDGLIVSGGTGGFSSYSYYFRPSLQNCNNLGTIPSEISHMFYTGFGGSYVIKPYGGSNGAYQGGLGLVYRAFEGDINPPDNVDAGGGGAGGNSDGSPGQPDGHGGYGGPSISLLINGSYIECCKGGNGGQYVAPFGSNTTPPYVSTTYGSGGVGGNRYVGIPGSTYPYENGQAGSSGVVQIRVHL